MGGKIILGELKSALVFYRSLGFDRLPVLVPKSIPVYRHRKITESFDKVAEFKALREEIGDCKRCKLCKGRTHIVFGEGDPEAEIMFIGEGPGKDEDIQGRPFVGEAGQVLTNLIVKLGLKREDVYIGNIVKCRPPNNRTPEDDEITTCVVFIKRQIEIIQPKVIITLGNVATQTLLEIKTPITRIRGHFQDYEGIPVMPTFHPAYLLRNRQDKILVWNDALKVMKKIGREVL